MPKTIKIGIFSLKIGQKHIFVNGEHDYLAFRVSYNEHIKIINKNCFAVL